MIPLIAISVLAGAGMGWVLYATSDEERIRAVKRRVQAHLLELRVYRDEPAVMWQAQKSLFAANARYVLLMLRPALWMSLPLLILLPWMDARFGYQPLPVGSAAVVTVALRGPVEGARVVLETPDGIAVETPAVRVPEERQVSWRIRASRTASGNLRVGVNGHTVEKRVEAGRARIGDGVVDWVEIGYPESGTRWLVWFTAVSMGTALVVKKLCSDLRSS
jgi:hypothetical protein